MINKLINLAKMGKSVYITDVRKEFMSLEKNKSSEFILLFQSLDKETYKKLILSIPSYRTFNEEETTFIQSYLYAEIYNVLSSVGAKNLTVFIDTNNEYLTLLANSLDEIYYINYSRKERTGYGRCINVLDRILEANSKEKGTDNFKIFIKDTTKLEEIQPILREASIDIPLFQKVTTNLRNKNICGMDVGGTDIKVAMVADGNIVCFKEYDWFPSNFIESKQIIEPMCMLIRLVKIKTSLLQKCGDFKDEKEREGVSQLVDKAMEKEALYKFICEVVEFAEEKIGDSLIKLDAIGLCFPDVVINNKIVGGEVYKTRGMRNNTSINYEENFEELTLLNNILLKLCREGGKVKITNDGPMASFTAAVELVADGKQMKVQDGIYAHTLGTELGTGWIDDQGKIPEIPLEVYNCIIDLGSFYEKTFESDDLRSINNFNTGLAGTLQKYASQSGVFRLAIKYFSQERLDLYQELFDKGYIVERKVGDKIGLYVPTEEIDMRKEFLEHIMSLPEREQDKTCNKIFTDIGEFLAITWFETDRIMEPKAKSRVLFGRLVKNETCFKLIVKGAKMRKEDIDLEVAGSSLANTPLMKQLEKNEHYTVAQFAQAVGAVYYGNLALI